MNIFIDWKFYIVVYLIISVIFNQSYKIITKKNINDGSLTILVQFFSVVTCIFFLPFFDFKLPSDYKVYFFLFLSIIFYTINQRLGTTSRKGLETSSYIILKQLSTVFMICISIFFLKEPIILNKIIGSILIIISNVIMFLKKQTLKINKYFILGILSNISLTLALFLDVNYSNEFNLSFYILLTFLIPMTLIIVFERIKFKNIIEEYKNSNKIFLLFTGFCWVIMMITKLKAYEFGKISIVAPISSLSVILNVFVSYFFLEEKNDLWRKIIAGILILIGIVLIKIS